MPYVRVSEKNKQNYFCYNYIKLPPNLTIFGTMMANCLKLYYMRCTDFPPECFLRHDAVLLCKRVVVLCSIFDVLDV